VQLGGLLESDWRGNCAVVEDIVIDEAATVTPEGIRVCAFDHDGDVKRPGSDKPIMVNAPVVSPRGNLPLVEREARDTGRRAVEIDHRPLSTPHYGGGVDSGAPEGDVLAVWDVDGCWPATTTCRHDNRIAEARRVDCCLDCRRRAIGRIQRGTNCGRCHKAQRHHAKTQLADFRSDDHTLPPLLSVWLDGLQLALMLLSVRTATLGFALTARELTSQTRRSLPRDPA
jgi:hypothetical protein